jgi:hypothetical protein
MQVENSFLRVSLLIMIARQASADMIYLCKNWPPFSQKLSVADGPYSNDIGLIKVRALSEGGISFNSHVRPICLPELQAKGATGSWCSVTGWGAQRRELYSICYMNQSASSVSDVFCYVVILNLLDCVTAVCVLGYNAE